MIFKKTFIEFLSFIKKGNIFELAIGIIIGAAFQSIVLSLVNDIISPSLGLIIKVDFNYLSIKINNVDIKYGAFLTKIIYFFCLSIIVFLMLKIITKVSLIKNKNDKVLTKICPYCKNNVNIEAIKCPYCTSNI